MLLKPIVVLCLALSVVALTAFAQVEDNAEHAFRISKEANKPVLLIFAGSDWCAPCIRFDKQILSKADFQAFAKDNLIILKADFPQRKPLPKELEKQNAALAEKYNPRGLFPYFVLLTPGQSLISAVSYANQSPQEFITEIKNHLSE